MAANSISIPKVEPRGFLHLAVRILWLTLPLLILLPLHIIWHRLKLPSPWAMLFLRVAARAMGARVKTHGTPVRKDVLFVANHVSWHDIPILGGIMGTAFVAQDGVAKWPVIGWLAKLNGTIFISRTDKQNVANQIAQLREAFDQNWSITLFPEGTTSDGTGLLPFKQSLFESIAPPPKPMLVQPVLLDFGDAGPDIAWLGAETGWESAWRAFTRPGSYAVNVHFLEPFDPRDFGERKQLCTEARQRILSALGELRKHPAA